ncbi:oligosaccharide flippase family protein [Mycolicibacterium neoaurum]|uniref:oligosaccharide flippase family protein n=1 Tax=Mycolicibacterium neoaurum TaxID=1795 RepID=UPI001BCDF41C|nr:oligosaccharide flippase family protein [Mycolicibacterium neoaurum]QVI27578.1 oligosaccharide flippase family protein [Mycolicibacterium neoaurum]
MSLARGVVVTAFGNFVPPVAALATQPILAHTLGVDGRGEVAAATAPVLLGIVVLGLGVPESLTFFVARRAPRLTRTLCWSIAALTISGLLGMGLLKLLSPMLSAGSDELADLMFIATSGLVPALIVAGLRGLAAGYRAWGLIAVERAGSALLRFTSIAALAVVGHLDVTTATISISATTFAGGLSYASLLIKRKQRRTQRSANSLAPLPSFPLYAAQVWFGAAAGIVYSRIDQMLITPLAGVYELGLYAVAASIAEVILLINTAVRDVIFTAESESPDHVRSARAARLSTMVTLGLGVFGAALCPWAIPLLFGDAFEQAVPITLLLILATVLGNPGSVAGAVLNGRGRPGLRSLSLAIGVVINLVAVFALVPEMGALGAALATLIASALAGNNLNIVWLRILYGVRVADYLALRRDDIRALGALVHRVLPGG